MTTLIDAQQRCRRHPVRLEFVEGHRAVLRPLELSGLREVMPVRPDVPVDWVVRLRTALTSRVTVAQATGILMAVHHLSANRAACQLAEQARHGCYPSLSWPRAFSPTYPVPGVPSSPVSPAARTTGEYDRGSRSAQFVMPGPTSLSW